MLRVRDDPLLGRAKTKDSSVAIKILYRVNDRVFFQTKPFPERVPRHRRGDPFILFRLLFRLVNLVKTYPFQFLFCILRKLS
jgi:hypothetical protein